MTSGETRSDLISERAWLMAESRREFETGHVCGNCRNPWSKTGRDDCPNNRRTP